MKKTIGIFILLLFVFFLTALLSSSFLTPFNLENLIRRTSLFGIISIGVAFVIITGGIDLSIGSVICLIGCGLPFCLQVSYIPLHQSSVQSVETQSALIRLAHPANDLASGDYLRLSDTGADNLGIYRITARNATDGGGVALTVDPAPPAGSVRGTLQKVLPIRSRDAASKSISLAGATLNPRDRITFVSNEAQIGQTVRVETVTGSTGELQLTLTYAAGDTETYVIPLSRKPRMSVPFALLLVFLLSLAIGMTHGLMVAKLKLQPFVVTLCGLLLYRGITRGFTEDQTQGFGDEYPVLRLIATAEIAKVNTAQALGIIGGIVLALGLVWFFLARRKQRSGTSWHPLVPIALGVVIALSGLYNRMHEPVVAVPASETESASVDLPAGATRVTLEAATAQGSWTALTDLNVQASEDSQQIRVPSLADIRQQKPGEWQSLRLVVRDRVLPLIGVPAPCLILILVAVLAGVFLNYTIYGRYLLALGRNEEAAKYSGINTGHMIIMAYVICSLLAGLGGVLFVLDVNSAQPVDFGNFYELYAIAAAVLGGCSLRGGEGTILGVVIGAALMRVLKNMITLVDWIPTHIEYAVIGAVILAGVSADELVKRIAARRKLAQK